jgi:uncharacterized protein with von Willebrand factor type A (vWA) domain
MLVELFFRLRAGGIPVSLTEFLMFLQALDRRVAGYTVEDLYALGRAAMVKDERHYDRFDRLFGDYMHGVECALAGIGGDVPADWLKAGALLQLSEEERAQVQSMGGFARLLEELRRRLAEQQGRHQGGDRWIGTGGRSPYGADGYNPEGVRMGRERGRQGRAVKVWERREYRNLDDSVTLGTRNIRMGLRALRRLAREGADTELDLPATVRATADSGGLLDLRLVPERHNAVKVLLLLDVGGSMESHVRVCEELFSAARSEFKHLEHYYFHNFTYATLWRDNRRRHAERVPTMQIIHTYGADYRLILVGDATMSPYEINYEGGSVEEWNEEPGAVWMRRLLSAFERAAWLNPVPQRYWDRTASIEMTRNLMAGRMFPTTLKGIEEAVASLRRAG